jgi:hypothetical protein
LELEVLMVDADCKRADMMSSRRQFGELSFTALASTVFDTLLFQRQFSALILTIFDII